MRQCVDSPCVSGHETGVHLADLCRKFGSLDATGTSPGFHQLDGGIHIPRFRLSGVRDLLELINT